MRKRLLWTPLQKSRLVHVQSVLEELREYKPLTLRQVYYQLVGKGLIENNVSQYTMLSTLLKWARIDGFVEWEDIEDRARVFRDSSGWLNKNQFIEQELNYFLKGYRRNLLQSQNRFIEIWFEKDALSSIFRKVADPYCVSTFPCKGFSSVSGINDFKGRLEENRDKQAVMLYFGDLDPSGIAMLESMQKTLQDELDAPSIEFKRVALLKEDIETYKLPNDPDALKKSDTRAKKYVEIYGELAVELDALRPDILKEKIKQAIEAELDMDALKEEVLTYQTEINELRQIKAKAEEFINTIM